jgi:ABC-2 type transport system permease protein
MGMFRMILKELTHGSRNWRTNAIMILFPIVLMVTLGSALGGMFGGAVLGNVRALYTIRDGGQIGPAFDAFKSEVEKLGVTFTAARDSEEGKRAVRDITYSCYLVVSADGISLYKNDRYGFEADFMQSLLTAFLQRFNAVIAIASVNPAMVARLSAPDGTSFVESSTLQANRKPRALDYYGVSMLTLIIMYSSL